ncbi:MAG: chemotaxis protein CheD [Verrucomicrobiota bacterium]
MSSPSIAALFGQRVVIGVGDLSVSNNPAITLSTYALGSCIAVVAYDATVRAGGLLHAMLPTSSLSPEKAGAQPAMFVDTGLNVLLRTLTGMKVDRRRMHIFLAGGASVLSGSDMFKIGERNIRATLAYLGGLGIRVSHSEVGGTINRTVHLNIGTGEISLKTPTATEKWSLAA